MYQLVYSDKALKQISKFDRILKQRILNSLERIRIRPHSRVKKMVGCPYYSLRVGDYRVILDLKDNKLTILVIEMGHRKNIYK